MSATRRSVLVLVAGAAAGVVAWETRALLHARSLDADAAATAAPSAASDSEQSRPVTSLGRLEPKHGVIRVAGPSKMSVVVSQLLVEEGDAITQGQTIAVLDNHASVKADVARLRNELEHAEAEQRRNAALYRDGILSASEWDTWRTKANVAHAALEQAEAELKLAVVRAPIDGRVLQIYTREGEKVGADGIAELGRTDEMYAIAEVYETDIGRVRRGQRATISGPALREPLHGTVEKIHLKVGKQDVLDTDPTAKTDARVVEVEIPLDEVERAAGLTNLQVYVSIEP
jgi:HlyD family secretion protein